MPWRCPRCAAPVNLSALAGRGTSSRSGTPFPRPLPRHRPTGGATRSPSRATAAAAVRRRCRPARANASTRGAALCPTTAAAPLPSSAVEGASEVQWSRRDQRKVQGSAELPDAAGEDSPSRRTRASARVGRPRSSPPPARPVGCMPARPPRVLLGLTGADGRGGEGSGGGIGCKALPWRALPVHRAVPVMTDGTARRRSAVPPPCQGEPSFVPPGNAGVCSSFDDPS